MRIAGEPPGDDAERVERGVDGEEDMAVLSADLGMGIAGKLKINQSINSIHKIVMSSLRESSRALE